MRLLQVVSVVDDQACYGGPLTIAVHQCRELRRRGHDARLAAGWAGQGPPPPEIDGVPVHLFPIRNTLPGVRLSGRQAPELLSWLRANATSFDAAHLHLTRDLIPLMAGFWLRRAGVPYVTQTHGLVLPDGGVRALAMDRALTLPLLRDAVQRFVLGRDEEAQLAELLGYVPSTQRLANGLAVSASDSPFVVPRRAGQELNVLFMGQLHPREQVMDFALAAAELIIDGVPARFSVAGPAGGDLAQLQAFLQRDPRLTDQLVYEGPVPREQTMDRLAQADIFVLPSAGAPSPITLLEALAVATPSICTTGCGFASGVRAEGAGLVVEPGPAGLAQGMRFLLSSQQDRISLSARAPEAVSARFSMRAPAEQLLRAYSSALSSAPTPVPPAVPTPAPEPAPLVLSLPAPAQAPAPEAVPSILAMPAQKPATPPVAAKPPRVPRQPRQPRQLLRGRARRRPEPQVVDLASLLVLEPRPLLDPYALPAATSHEGVPHA